MAGSMSFGPMAPAAPYAATTDAEGKFRIEGVEPGMYRMMAERQGFVRREYGARKNSMMGSTITVASGQELKELNIDMIPQAVIIGRVLDDEGEPLARVQIQVMRRRYFRGKQQLMPMGGNMTMDTGEFRIADLAPGRYWISAMYRRMSMFGEGPARNAGDKPEEEYVTTYYPGVIDQAGARPIDVVAGQELPGVDIRLQKAPVYRIRGKVTGGTEPARNLRVMVMPRDSMMMMGFMGNAGGMVKEDGSFEIGGVQSGAYYVSAMHNQGRPTAMGKVAVDVGRGNVENVALVLTAPLTLNGVIRIDGNVEQLEKAAGKKITFSSVRVQLMPMEGMNFGNAGGGQAKDDGTFTLENVGHDKFRVMAMNFPQGTWLKSIRAGDQEVLEAGLDLNAGSPGPLQVTLGVGTGSVSGTVQDANQKPVSASMVQLIPDPMKEERYDLYRVVSSDQSGQFTMQGIPPGEYKVFALDDVEPGLSTDPEFLKTHDSKTTKVTVKENSQQSVSLTQISVESN